MIGVRWFCPRCRQLRCTSTTLIGTCSSRARCSRTERPAGERDELEKLDRSQTWLNGDDTIPRPIYKLLIAIVAATEYPIYS